MLGEKNSLQCTINLHISQHFYLKSKEKRAARSPFFILPFLTKNSKKKVVRKNARFWDRVFSKEERVGLPDLPAVSHPDRSYHGCIHIFRELLRNLCNIARCCLPVLSQAYCSVCLLGKLERDTPVSLRLHLHPELLPPAHAWTHYVFHVLHYLRSKPQYILFVFSQRPFEPAETASSR